MRWWRRRKMNQGTDRFERARRFGREEGSGWIPMPSVRNRAQEKMWCITPEVLRSATDSPSILNVYVSFFKWQLYFFHRQASESRVRQAVRGGYEGSCFAICATFPPLYGSDKNLFFLPVLVMFFKPQSVSLLSSSLSLPLAHPFPL